MKKILKVLVLVSGIAMTAMYFNGCSQSVAEVDEQTSEKCKAIEADNARCIYSGTGIDKIGHDPSTYHHRDCSSNDSSSGKHEHGRWSRN